MRRGEARLTSFTGKLGLRPGRMEARIWKLEAAEEAGAFTRPPASGSGGRECRAGARDRGRCHGTPGAADALQEVRSNLQSGGEAVRVRRRLVRARGRGQGRIEPRGEHGPLQRRGYESYAILAFDLGKQYGLDGNRDGEANIMDPEDAIPAAASYLEVGARGLVRGALHLQPRRLVRPRGSGYSGVLQASGWRRRGGSLRLGRRGRPIKN